MSEFSLIKTFPEHIQKPATQMDTRMKVDLISQRLPLKRKAPNDDDQPKSLSNHSDVEEERLLDNIEDDIEHVSALIKRAKRLHHTQSQSSKDGLNDETEQLTPPPDIESLLERAEAIIAKLKANILLELKRLTLEEEILGKRYVRPAHLPSRLIPVYIVTIGIVDSYTYVRNLQDMYLDF
ncbi:hypothetical protein BDQ17DRAFT_1321721 [Cyathus striatus]|nr:hypothetical protein BDQ17DRAFT_1321721 [Cyathus striatus]